MAFPLDKILTISAQEYYDISDSVTLNYSFKGVHLSKLYAEKFEVNHAMDDFAKLVPENAEVVVAKETKTSASELQSFYVQISGTALIPKK